MSPLSASTFSKSDTLDFGTQALNCPPVQVTLELFRKESALEWPYDFNFETPQDLGSLYGFNDSVFIESFVSSPLILGGNKDVECSRI